MLATSNPRVLVSVCLYGFLVLCCFSSSFVSAICRLPFSHTSCLPCVQTYSRQHKENPNEPFPQLLVTLRVFSGSNDPQWILNSSTAEKLIKLSTPTHSDSDSDGEVDSADDIFTSPPFVPQRAATRLLGYSGFLVSCPLGQYGVLIRGNVVLEQYLLDDISHRFQRSNSITPTGINAAVLKHVASFLGDTSQLDYTTALALSHVQTDAGQCQCPIVGPDTPPRYDPLHDDEGCFVTDQGLNNCYAYGCDIVTDTFPQPGRGSGKIWSENTCEDMGAASVRDGLEYYGTALPAAPPKNGTGHYVALLIWPDTNFHWIRMDANNDNSTGVPVYYWSHKPGSTAVRNVDNNGDLITNPALSDFSPWTQFCAYYRAQPSVLTIN